MAEEHPAWRSREEIAKYIEHKGSMVCDEPIRSRRMMLEVLLNIRDLLGELAHPSCYSAKSKTIYITCQTCACINDSSHSTCIKCGSALRR